MYWLASFIFCLELKNGSTVEPQHNGKKKWSFWKGGRQRSWFEKFGPSLNCVKKSGN